MDHGSFDRIARLLGAAGSRRAALGALLGAGALGASEAAAAKNNRKRDKGKKAKNGVSAQAVCAPPDNGVNRSNCDYTGEDFSGQAIHSSIYKNTIFRNADLVETDLSSSNMRAANFRGANLCGADLSSSTLRDADFRGFNPAMGGRVTNLTNADLHSSGCAGILTNQFTIFCNTIGCDGEVINPGCSGQCGPPPPPICDEPITDTSCDCLVTWIAGDPVCVQTIGSCGNPECTTDDGCSGDAICVRNLCCQNAGRCVQPCSGVQECTCTTGQTGCDTGFRCGEPVGFARRSSAGPVKGKSAP